MKSQAPPETPTLDRAGELLEKDLNSLTTVDGVTIIPVVHFRQEWARLARVAIDHFKPGAVAVELPGSMTIALGSAISRLPCLSLAILEYSDDHVRFFPVEPTDPIVEAVRRAEELGIPWKAVDTETPVYPESDEAIPDPYAAFLVGHLEYRSACLNPDFALFSRIPQDEIRESTMAFHCRKMVAEHGSVLLVCGLAHAEGVARAIAGGAEAIPIPLGGIPEVVLATPHPDTIREVFSETPAVMAAWEIARRGEPVSINNEPETTEADESEVMNQWFFGQDDELPEGFEHSDPGFESMDPPEGPECGEAGGGQATSGGEAQKITSSTDGALKTGGVTGAMAEEGPASGRAARKGRAAFETNDIGPEQANDNSAGSATLGGLLASLARKALSALGLADIAKDGTDHQPQGRNADLPQDRTADLPQGRNADLSKDETPIVPDDGPGRSPVELQLVKSTPRADSEGMNDFGEDPLSLLLQNLLFNDFEDPFGNDLFSGGDDRPPKPPFPFKKMAKYLAAECGLVNLDRIRLLFRLIRQAAELLRAEQGEEITPLHLSNLLKFARNYAMVEGLLVPSAWHLAVGCRGVSGDDFAWHFWRLATTYPWHDVSGALPVACIRGEDLWSRGRRFKLERKVLGRNAARRRNGPVKARPRERRPGEWERSFNSWSLCSYPPEDIVIEGWGDYLKKRSRQIISAESASIREFTTSLLDGIDLRETVRNWHHKKIFVRENGRARGEVGTIVVIFDGDGDDAEFPWKVTWHGEHDQESDMVFYATRPGADLAGPGIARCRYGGFMLSYPPGRLSDVWRDPVFLNVGGGSLSKPDHLLLAALDYSLDRYVAYVAAKPPASRLVSLGRKMDRRIVYIPLGTFSPVTLRKMRVFHVLAGKEVREVAGDYIFR